MYNPPQYTWPEGRRTLALPHPVTAVRFPLRVTAAQVKGVIQASGAAMITPFCCSHSRDSTHALLLYPRLRVCLSLPLFIYFFSILALFLSLFPVFFPSLVPERSINRVFIFHLFFIPTCCPPPPDRVMHGEEAEKERMQKDYVEEQVKAEVRVLLKVGKDVVKEHDKESYQSYS